TDEKRLTRDESECKEKTAGATGALSPWLALKTTGTDPLADHKTHFMNLHDLIRELREPAKTKIVLLVADGLGGLPLEPGGLTELETARRPQLDALARDGVCGLSVPVLPGITP